MLTYKINKDCDHFQAFCIKKKFIYLIINNLVTNKKIVNIFIREKLVLDKYIIHNLTCKIKSLFLILSI